MTYYDPIVEEIHRHRREYAAKFNNDLDAMFADIRKRQEELKKQGYKFVQLPPRRIPPVPAPLDPQQSHAHPDSHVNE